MNPAIPKFNRPTNPKWTASPKAAIANATVTGLKSACAVLTSSEFQSIAVPLTYSLSAPQDALRSEEKNNNHDNQGAHVLQVRRNKLRGGFD